jgi:cytochrome P450 family 142 subfamily A polypeptide 1
MDTTTAEARAAGQPMPPFEIDILDPRLYDDPWEAYRWLRHNAPLWWDARNEMWVVSRHEDVSHISRNQELYSAAQGVRPKVSVPMSLISMDDPEHLRLRRLVNKGFTPRMVRRLGDHIRELTVELIDEVADRGEVEFVRDFAIHVPLIVIAELLGLDPGIRMQLYQWSEDMFAGDGHIDPDDPALERAMTAAAELGGLLTETIERRRQDGSTDDLIGILTQAYDDGALAADTDAGGAEIDLNDERLSNDELLMFLFILLGAGNETTRNAISGGLRAFTLFPGERDKLIENPELIDKACDEIVRFVSPVLSFMRTVTTDHTHQGVDLRAGDRVFMLYQSANRDEAVFDDPDEFRIDRDPNPHLGFGIGTHYCLGANLARNELQVVFQELFGRLSDIRAKDPATLTRGDSTLVLAIDRLPAVFTPETTT